MRILPIVFAAGALLAPVVSAQESRTWVGIITDTMCTTSHQAMKVSPEDKCVRDCVGDGKTYKYALMDAKGLYVLSDQQTPARFAGTRVKVTGVLYRKTNILKVERIEAAR